MSSQMEKIGSTASFSSSFDEELVSSKKEPGKVRGVLLKLQSKGT